MVFEEALDPRRCIFLAGEAMTDAIEELTSLFQRERHAIDSATLMRLVLEREDAAPTIIAPGIAAPHAIVSEELPTLIAVGVSQTGVRWEGPRETETVYIVVLLVGSRASHLTVLSEVAHRLRDTERYTALLDAESPREIYNLLTTPQAAENATTTPAGTVALTVLRHAVQLQDELPGAITVIHVDGITDIARISSIIGERSVIFVSATPADLPDQARFPAASSVVIPLHGAASDKHRRFVLLYLYSNGYFTDYRTVIAVAAQSESGDVDSIRIIDIAKTFGDTGDLQRLVMPGDLDRSVFARVIQLAEDIAVEGREGKPVGALFVLGDYENVVEKTRQLIVNPFRGYPEHQRSILDPTLDETVKEFAKIDGAFLIRGDGVIASAGTFLAGQPQSADHHSGLGARHAAAQGITAVTEAIAVVVSESTRSVSVFHGGSRILVS